MPIKLADVFVAINADSSGFDRAADRTQKKAGALQRILEGIGQGIGQALYRSAEQGFRALVGGIDQSIDRASDLNESINKTGAVFGQSAQEILDWSQTASSALGQSQQQALEAAASFGNLFTSLGFARGDAADMSTQLVELASDLASFNNIDPTEALEKLRAGVVGETEPLRVLGVNLSAAAVEAKAMELGLADSTKAISEQDKVTARLAIIMQQTAAAQGDFARTADGTANASRRVAAGFEDLSATIGGAFEPIKRVVLNTLADIIESVQPYAENIVAQIANGLAVGLRFVLPVLQTLRSIFVYWLQPGSPPRLLPELVAWGKSAVGEYLKGWGEADFGAFDKLSSSIENILRSFVDTGDIGEIDIVGRVFGTRDAIARAITQFREIGSVSQDVLNQIAFAAGPAGNEVAGVVGAYFRLEEATRATARAQDELNAVNERFSDIIDPLEGQLSALRDREQAIRRQQQKERLQEGLNDPRTSSRERELIQLQLQQLELQGQLADANREKGEAVADAEENLTKAQETEAGAKESLNIQEAILNQRVKENQLIGEQVRLQKQLADAAKRAAEAANNEAIREAEKAQRELEAALKASQREAEQLADAQLRYRLQLADTPGKIAIMREELAKAEDGSVEYFNILTQIASLEQQLANQRSSGASAFSLPDVLPPELPNFEELTGPVAEAGENLGAVFSEALKIFTDPESSPPPDWLVSAKEAIDNLILGIGQMNEAFGKSFNSERFTSLSDEVTTFLKFINENWLGTTKSIGDDTDTFWEDQGTTAATKTEELLLLVELFLNALQGDWAEAWQNIKQLTKAEWDANEEDQGSWLSNLLGNFGTFYDDAIKGVAKWLLDTAKSFTDWFQETEESFNDWLTGVYDSFADFDLAEAGRKMLDSLFSGMKAKWGDLSSWFSERLTELRNQLPFSEPKDPRSPLRGLAQSGEALIGQVQQGIERASLNINPFATAGLQPVGGLPSGGDTINITINGAGENADLSGIRSAAEQGVMAARRARGS